MKPPTYAPVFAALYPIFCEAARNCGYALAVHGTLNRDFDLIAIPWSVTATDVSTLVEAIKASTPFVERVQDPVSKEHGRIAVGIILDGGGAFIDFSVMPRTP